MIGGLSVAREVMKALPGYQILYFGDTARVPYGNKGPETIIKFGLEDAAFLQKHGASVIVIACNTASAVAAEAVKKASPVPVFEVITPAVEQAVKVTKNKKIGVLGTYATVGSGVYERLLKERDHFEVFARPAPLLVPLVEEGWLDKPETKRILKHYLRPLLQKNIDTLILACTHYPFLKDLIKQYAGRRVTLIDPAEVTARALAGFLQNHPEIDSALPRGDEHQFFLSDLTPRFKSIAEKWLGHTIKIEKASI